MQEDFLHYLWQFKKFKNTGLKTVNNQAVTIQSVGTHNLNAGPDFFNAQLKIEQQAWAGNVEIHVKASDWYVHHHETDPAYDNVILHVVWEHDIDVHRQDNTIIPTLELKTYINTKALSNYKALFLNPKLWINCENSFSNLDHFTINNWVERLYFERLERKSQEIEVLLQASKNNWEAVLFKMLAKNFGSKINSDAFFSMANTIDFNIIRKLQLKPLELEALFMGQAQILTEDTDNLYALELLKTYRFLAHKYKLNNSAVVKTKFFRLRPANFPTLRLSQLAALFAEQQNLFSKIIEANTLEHIYKLFNVQASIFWDTHYTFSKATKSSKKKLSKSFIDLLIINTIIPLKFSYAKYQDKPVDDHIINMMSTIKSEKNSIVDKFNNLKKVANNALQSQGLLQLKNEYCDHKRCLKCEIGSKLLNK